MQYRMDCVIPTETTNRRWKIYQFKNLEYGDVDTKNFFYHQHHDIRYEERPYSIRHKEIPYHENIVIDGHFLSHKYIDPFFDRITSMFGFKWRYRPSTIAVHTRVGDYKKMPQHLPVLGLGYYHDAIDYAFDKTGINELLVFGEDLEHNQKYFTKENFPYLKKISFVIGNDEITDLELMSGCPVLVGANSTYSIWANYLNQHSYKMFIAPKQYYGPAYGEVFCGDLWPDKTILI